MQVVWELAGNDLLNFPVGTTCDIYLLLSHNHTMNILSLIYSIVSLTVLVKKKVAKHTRTLREGSRGACAREAFALFAY